MRIFSLILLFAMMTFAAVSPDKVHPGLRKAVDNGDITTAQSLRQMGVKDVYCPATMSPSDAVKLYENELREQPSVIYSSCEEGFLKKIEPLACHNPRNVKLCKEVFKNKIVQEWPFLVKDVVKSEMYKYPGVSFADEMREFKKYLLGWVEYKPFYVAKHDKKLDKVRDYYLILASNEECDVSDSCYVETVKKQYLKDGDLSDRTLLYGCWLHPNLDVDFQKSTNLNIFSCQDVFAKYSEECRSEEKVTEVYTTLNKEKVAYFKCDVSNSEWRRVDEAEAGQGTEKCTDDKIGTYMKSKTNSLVFKCNEKHQWVEFGTQIGSTVWTIRNMWNGHFAENNASGYADYKNALNACPSGWRLPSKLEFEELKTNVTPFDLLSKNYFGASGQCSYCSEEPPAITDKWKFSAMQDNQTNSLGTSFWGDNGNALEILLDDRHDGFSAARIEVKNAPEKYDPYYEHYNDESYYKRSRFVRCVASYDRLMETKSQKPKTIASSSSAESVQNKEVVQKQNPVETNNLKQETASAAAEAATPVSENGKQSMSTTKLLRIIVSSAVVLGGSAAAYMFDKKAKDATATPPTNEQEFKKGHDDAKQNQNVRNISLGITAAGLIALGLTFLF